MIVKFHRRYNKQYAKLSKPMQKKADEVIKKFRQNPYNKALYNHPLKGLSSNKRSISVTGDLRIIFKEYENYTLVIMLQIGTHSQLY
jgi:addiction module RelE/StbE family toxin